MPSNAKALSFLSGDLSLSGSEVSINVAGSVQSDSITGSTITMKNTGNTILASDGTTSVLSESSGTVTFDADVSTIGSATISGGSITGTEIDLKSSGTTIFASNGTTAVLSESGSVVTLTADAAVIEGSSSGDLVRITQTGTGNALVVEDSANPDSTPFVVNSSGNVGIGTSFIGAGGSATRLQVSNANNATVGTQANLMVTTTDPQGANIGGVIGLGGSVTTGSPTSNMRLFGAIRGAKENPNEGYSDGYLAFYTMPSFSTTATERMRIDSSGNVGIGTSPSYKLHVFGGSGSATVAKFFATNYGNLGTTYIELGTEYGDGGSRIGNVNPTGNYGTLVFETMTGTSGVFAERMRIDSSGNVKINNLGSGDVNATSGTLNISSDIRLKNDLGVIDESGIEIIKQLTPRYYSWKDDENSRQQLGFFAQEVFPILPEAVPRDLKYEQNGVDENGEPILEQVLDDNGEPDYQWGFATQPIVAMCVKAIQEQQTIIESQQSQIDALTARIEALETT
jgi:hypothetical protein